MASRRPNEREGVHGLHFGPYHHSLNRLSAPAQMRTTSNHAEYKISQTFRAVHKRKVPLADICHHGLYRTHFFGKHDLALVKFQSGKHSLPTATALYTFGADFFGSARKALRGSLLRWRLEGNGQINDATYG